MYIENYYLSWVDYFSITTATYPFVLNKGSDTLEAKFNAILQKIDEDNEGCPGEAGDKCFLVQ